MSILKKININTLFANWIKPFDSIGTVPPNEPLKFVYYYLKKAKLPIFLMLILGGLVAGIEAGMFYFIGQIIDIMDKTPRNITLLVERYKLDLIIMVGVVVFLRTFFIWVLSLIQNLTFTLSFSMMVRWQAYTYVAQQSMDFFNNNMAGSIERKVWESGGAISNLVNTLIQTLWFILIYSLTTLFLVGKIEPKVAVLLMSWIVVYAIIAYIYVPKIRDYSVQHSESGSKVKGTIVDNFSNIITLKLFGSYGQGKGFVRDGFEEYYNDTKKLTCHISNATNLVTLLSGLMITMISWCTFDRWAEGSMTSGAVAFTLGLVLRLNSMLSGLLTQLNVIMRHVGSLKSCAKLISKSLSITDVDNAKELNVTGGGIIFDHVCFRYRHGKSILNNLSFTIKPGEKVAIVGPSGAGKTTIFNLLLRLYEPYSGKIIIDGQDISNVTQVSLHDSVVAVTQDGGLIHRSVRDNLVLGRDDITELDIEKAVKIAKIDDFVYDLEDKKKRKGLDAFVGERGVKLSGGQRQRITIARVMLKDSSIYIFDEASSALDSETEAAIHQEILEKMKGKTVIMIAHRLSTVTSMDRLLVLRKGEIVEQGSHQQLIEMNGIYSKLWQLQSGGYH